MRRMKIRAIPNIGGGGGGGGGGSSQRVNQPRAKPPSAGPTIQSHTETEAQPSNTDPTKPEQSTPSKISEIVLDGNTDTLKKDLYFFADPPDVNVAGGDIIGVCNEQEIEGQPSNGSADTTKPKESTSSKISEIVLDGDTDSSKKNLYFLTDPPLVNLAPDENVAGGDNIGVCNEQVRTPSQSSENSGVSRGDKTLEVSSGKKSNAQLLSKIDDEVQEISASENTLNDGACQVLESFSSVNPRKEYVYPDLSEFDGSSLRTESEAPTSCLEKQTVLLQDEEADSSSPSMAWNPLSAPGGAILRRPRTHAKPSLFGPAGKKTDNKSDLECKFSDSASKEVVLDEREKGSAVTGREKGLCIPGGASIRRPKIRAKPSLFGTVGKKTQSQVREKEITPVIPVTVIETEEVILDEEVTSASVTHKEDILSPIGSVVKSPEIPTNRSLLDREGSEVERPSELDSWKDNATSKEITLYDENSSEGITVVEKVSSVPSEVTIRRPKIRAKPSLPGAMGRKSQSRVKKGAPSSCLKTEEVVLDEGEASTTSTPVTSMLKPSPKPVPLSSMETPSTKPVPSMEKPSFEPISSVEKLTTIPGPSVEKPQPKPIPSMENSSIKLVPNVENPSPKPGPVSTMEKSSFKPVGSSIRRPKIHAKPSILSAVGRKTESQLKAESKNPVLENLGVDLDKRDNSVVDVSNVKKDPSLLEEKILCELDAGTNNSNQENESIMKEEKCNSVPVEKVSAVPGGANVRRPRIQSKPSLLTSRGKKTVVQVQAEVHAPDSGKKESSENIDSTSTPCVKNVTSVPAGNNIRRSRIRATPALFAKRKVSLASQKDSIIDDSQESSVVDGEKDQESRSFAQEVEEEKSNNVNNLSNSAVEPKGECKDREMLGNPASVSDRYENGNRHSSSDCDINSDIKAIKSQATERSKAKPDSQEVINSDDSGGDKENSSKRLVGVKMARRERTVKEKGKLSTYCRTKAKVLQSDVQIKKRPIKSEGKLKSSDNEMLDDESEESQEKKIFRERKEKFRKKFSQSQGNMERGQMTMFDLIFWNPVTNPMPGRTDAPKKKENNNEGDDASSDVLEEQMVDDLGLDSKSIAEELRPNSPPSGKEVEVCEEDAAPSPKSTQGGGEEGGEAEDEKEALANDEDCKEGSGVDMFAPRVKIGPNGQIILDEQSIKIQTTAAKNRDEILSKAEVVEESNDSAHYGKWSKKRRRSCEWTMKETARFYKALSTVGTDFSLMETLFTWRSRAELKTKFKKEERTNRELIDRALKDCTQFDFTPFDDESDYDPEEDRKASRIAERAEAKRKRQEIKQYIKEEEKLKKKQLVKEEKEKVKERKALIRKMRNQMKSKRKAKEMTEADQETDYEDIGLDLSDSDVEFETSVKSTLQEGQKAVVKKSQRKRRVLKKKEPKQRKTSSPLEISEVTVTMEAVYEHQNQSKAPVAEFTIDEMTVCEDASVLQSNVSDNEEVNTDFIPPNISSEIAVDESFANEILASSSGNPEMCDEENVGSGSTEVNVSSISVKADGSGIKTVLAENEKMWHFPLSAIQVNEDGTRTVTLPSDAGEKLVPVPHLPPGTSNVVVVATKESQTAGEYIYHVYTVSPLAS